MLGNRFPTYADLNAFITGNAAILSGEYFVDNDETKNNVPMEYYVDANKKITPKNQTTIFNSELF